MARGLTVVVGAAVALATIGGGTRADAATTAPASLTIDPTLPAVMADEIRRTIASDREAVEQAFGRAFATAPVIHAYASTGAFITGLATTYGLSPIAATDLAASHAAAFLPVRRAIVVDWSRAAVERPLAVIRHELVHAMIRDIAGVDADVPAWLDEGLAMLASGQTLEPSNIARAAALLAGGGVSLARLRTPADWLKATRVSDDPYLVAAVATRSLELLVGRRVLIESLARTPEHGSFQAAFERLTGMTFAIARSEAVAFAAPAPGVQTGVAIDARGNVYWEAFGFVSGAALTVTVAGPGYALTFEVAADVGGGYRAVFGETAAPGVYRIGVTDGLRAGSATLSTVR